MEILSISRDKRFFEDNSDVLKRHIGYANNLDRLDIIVFTLKNSNFRDKKISSKFWVYPTNSFCRWLYLIDATRIGRRLIKPDLITAQDPFECGLVAWLLSRFFGSELELQVHTDIGSRYFRKESFINKLRFLIAKILLPKASKIRVVNNRIKDFINLKFNIENNKINVRPIFIDTENIRKSEIKTDLRKKYPQYEKIILMASRLSKEKNISLAILAFKEVIKNQNNTGLIIVGSGPEEYKLKSLVKKMNLESNIKFEPWTDDLVSYYKTTDLFLVTSFYEGYGMTIAEAKAANCPVISSDVGSARDLGAFLFYDFNPKILSDLILEKLEGK